MTASDVESKVPSGSMERTFFTAMLNKQENYRQPNSTRRVVRQQLTHGGANTAEGKE